MGEDRPAEGLAHYPSSCLADAHPQVQAVGAMVRPLERAFKVFGSARTAKLAPGHNAAIHRALHASQRGEVLVVSADGDIRYGYFGEILAQCCLDRGIAGLVIDGAVRDCRAIIELNFPVFCTGLSPRGSGKAEPGKIGTEISCGEARVRPGDFVAGDADGVVFIPRELAAEVLERAEGVLEREMVIKKRLAQGESTLQIFAIHTDWGPP